MKRPYFDRERVQQILDEELSGQRPATPTPTPQRRPRTGGAYHPRRAHFRPDLLQRIWDEEIRNRHV